MASLGLLLLPIPWCMGAVMAAAVHELAHLAAIYILGGQVTDFVLTPVGAQMTVLPMTGGREALCALAGPAASLALLALGNMYPELALCGAVQGLYNLLPVFPLDGGRIAAVLLPERICRALRSVVLTAAICLSLWIFFQTEIGMVSFLPAGFLCYTEVRRKISCKESNLAVQ